MSPWIDSHAHIYMQEFDRDRDAMLTRSQQQGVQKIYMPNVDTASIEPMMQVEQTYPDYCVSMMGLHPCAVKKQFEKALYSVESWLSKRKFAAIGEIGIDLYWDKHYLEQQKEAFIIQMKWAKTYELPVVVHCRDSLDETIALVATHRNKKMRGVFHCFSGSLDQAQQIVDMGFYLGLGGVSTFKNSGLSKIIPHLSLEHIVLETDSPYLRPMPHRGKRNEPACIPIIASTIALLKNISEDKVAVSTTANAKALFAL